MPVGPISEVVDGQLNDSMAELFSHGVVGLFIDGALGGMARGVGLRGPQGPHGAHGTRGAHGPMGPVALWALNGVLSGTLAAKIPCGTCGPWHFPMGHMAFLHGAHGPMWHLAFFHAYPVKIARCAPLGCKTRPS